MSLRITLRHHCQLLPLSGSCSLKGESHNSLDADTAEDGELGGDGVGAVLVCRAALPCVFALAVFADDDPIERVRVGFACRKRRLRAWEDSRGSDVDVLVHVFANGEDETPEGDMVGYIYLASA